MHHCGASRRSDRAPRACPRCTTPLAPRGVISLLRPALWTLARHRSLPRTVLSASPLPWYYRDAASCPFRTVADGETSTMHVCSKCGSREWLQFSEDGRRHALRQIRFKGLQPLFGAWRAPTKTEPLPQAQVVCARCGARASTDLIEGLSETPGFDDKPLVFVAPDQVDLDAIVARLRDIYGPQVLAVLDSDHARNAKTVPASRLAKLHPAAMEALRRKLGTDAPQLYEHQLHAIEHVRKGGNVILATATASGKSLCFQIPWIDSIAAGVSSQRPTALYLGPLNALIDDQFRSLAAFGDSPGKPRPGSAEALGFLARISLGTGVELTAAQYHGGVRPIADDDKKRGQATVRREIRGAQPDIVFSNPEMFAAAMLPLAIDVEPPGAKRKNAAGEWTYFFERLRYVVLDECHEFRGVYGSHLANLLRRLRRICALVGNTEPLRFVLCSATIRDPGAFAERLTGEARWLVVDRHADASERQDRKLVFLTKKDPTQPFLEFAKGALGVVFERERLSTIYFQESIPAVQTLHTRFLDSLKLAGLPKDTFGVFAATFLPDEKIDKLERLRSGHMRGVATTSALAMGIDIGSLSCSILAGYPGSIAKTWQMLGRAGRRGPGLQLFLVGESFMDQYWAQDPKELLDQERHLEEVIIAPDNEEILRDHILAAHYDHPLAMGRDRNFFGQAFDKVVERLLEEDGLLVRDEEDHEFLLFRDGASDRVFRIALRGTSRFKVPVYLGRDRTRPVLEEDQVRALRTLYPGAIFVHDGNFYSVKQLRYEQGTDAEDDRFYAVVDHGSGKEVTVPIVLTDIEAEESGNPEHATQLGPVAARFGRVEVSTTVEQYYVVPFDPQRPAEQAIALPRTEQAIAQPSSDARTNGNVKLHKVQRDQKTPAEHRYRTEGMWLVVPDAALDGLVGEDRFRALFTVGKALVCAIPPYHYASPDDLSFTPVESHPIADGRAAIFIYERQQGGIGLALATLKKIRDLAESALTEVLEGCPRCSHDPSSSGCVRCVADMSGLHDRRLAIRLLRSWLDGSSAPARAPDRAGAAGAPTKRRGAKTATRPRREGSEDAVAEQLTELGYEQITPIGKGGMGQVYRAVKEGHTWALKVAIASDDPDEVRRVAEEGLKQKRLTDAADNQNILRVDAVERTGGLVVLRLELAEGDLTQRLGPAGYRPHDGAAGGSPKERVRATVRALLPVVDALADLHRRGHVHRDVKPANIVIVDGQFKLADFGLLRRNWECSGDDTIGAGTLGYSPSWALAPRSKPDMRDDVYSLAVVLHEMLTGRTPRKGSAAERPLGVPVDLYSVLRKALEPPSSSKRFRDASEFKAALLGCVEAD